MENSHDVEINSITLTNGHLSSAQLEFAFHIGYIVPFSFFFVDFGGNSFWHHFGFVALLTCTVYTHHTVVPRETTGGGSYP